jgi:BMFP domain-containing protein YqiC
MPPARRNTAKESLAGTASDRVRAIIEAAETSAAEIRAEAEADAERIRGEAEERANVVRSEARSGVQALLGSIRDSLDSLRDDLAQLEQRLGEPEPAKPVVAPRDEPVGAPLEDDLDLATADEEDQDAARAADTAFSAPADEPTPDAVISDATHADESNLEGARLVALNMALNGAPRDEVDHYLRDNYELSDQSALLDEVYASIGS